MRASGVPPDSDDRSRSCLQAAQRGARLERLPGLPYAVCVRIATDQVISPPWLGGL